MKMSTPAAPDLGAATREGVMADIDTLPSRLAAEAAASAGAKYVDPTTGKTIDLGLGPDWRSYYTGNQKIRDSWAAKSADEKAAYNNDPLSYAEDYFNNIGKPSGDLMPTIGGDDARARRDIWNALQYQQGGADISRTLEKQRLEDMAELLPQFNELDLNAQKAAYEASLDAAKTGTAAQYDLDLKYRPKFTESELAAQKAAWEQSLDQGEAGTRRMTALQAELLPGVNKLGIDQQRQAFAAAAEAGRSADPIAAALRDQLLKQAGADLAQGGNLTPEQRMRAEENIRGSQVARGNVLGPAASVSEAMALTGYGDDLIAKRQQVAFQALGTQPLMPNFTIQNAVNPVVPNFTAGAGVPSMMPNFNATTSGGPNLGPTAVNKSSLWNYTNANAGQFGANFAKDVWNTKVQDNRAASQQMQDMVMGGAGMVMGMV